MADTVVANETFEGGAIGWSNGATDASEAGFTEFLGRFGAASGIVTQKTFDLPADATSLRISFDFYEIDSWNDEEFRIYLDGALVFAGVYEYATNEGTFSGSTGNVSWTSTALAAPTNIGFRSDQFGADQIHQIELVVANPGASITLGFGSDLDSAASNEAWGVDNVSVVAVTPDAAGSRFAYEYYDLSGETGDLAAAGFDAAGNHSSAPDGAGFINSLDEDGVPGLHGGDLEYFALKFTSQLTISTAGQYRFDVSSDDGAKLFIDGAVVVDHDGLHATETLSGSTTLSAGVHDVAIIYFENGGDQNLSVAMSGPDTGGATVDFDALNALSAEPATPSGAFGQSGAVTITQEAFTSWTQVAFAEEIPNAVVVAGPMTDNDGTPATVRIRNVTSTGFEIQIDEYEYLDGVHAAETISWLAVSEGTYTLADGRQITAGSAQVDSSATSVSFGQSFGSTPVVLATASTFNEETAVVTRLAGVSTGGFTAQLFEQEAPIGGNGRTHAAETVSFIAIETGGTNADVVARVTPDEVDEADYALSYGATFAQAPVLLAAMQSNDGADTSNLRVSNIGTSSATVRVAEEQSNDAEVAHTFETVGVVTLQAGLLTAAGVTPVDPGGSDPVLSLSGPSGPILEAAAGALVYTVTASETLDEDVTVTVSVSGAGASGPGSVTIPAGQSSANFTVSAPDDQAEEADETIDVSLGAVTAGAATVGAQGAVATLIQDDDTPATTSGYAVAVVSETAGARTRGDGAERPDDATGALGAPDAAYVNLDTPGDDFVLDLGEELNAGDTYTLSLRIRPDAAGAYTAFLNVSESTSSGGGFSQQAALDGTAGAQGASVSTGSGSFQDFTFTVQQNGVRYLLIERTEGVSVSNNEPEIESVAWTRVGEPAPVLTISGPTGPISETSAAAGLVYTVTADKVLDEDVTVAISVAGADASGPTSVTIAAGQSSVDFTVAVTNDLIEEPDETVSVTLGAVQSGSATIGAQNSAQTLVEDDDGVTGTFEGVYQAEGPNAELRTPVTDNKRLKIKSVGEGFEGEGYADYGNGVDEGESLVFLVQGSGSGTYTLDVRYALGSAASRPLEIAVDGVVVGILDFPTTGDFDNYQTVSIDVPLVGGRINEISLTSIGSSGANIDQIELTAADVGPNEAPVAANDSFGLPEDAIAVPLALLANDSDPNGDAIQIANYTQPTSGSLQLIDGVLHYTPAPGNEGSASFTYTLTDGQAESAPATVTLNMQRNHEQPHADYFDNIEPEIEPDGTMLVVSRVAQLPSTVGTTPARMNAFVNFGERMFVGTEGNVDNDSQIYELVDDGQGGFTAELFFDIGAAFPDAADGRDLNNANVAHGGLRGFAFHPDFETNGKLYTSIMEDRPADETGHTYLSDVANHVQADSVLVEWTVDPSTGEIDPASYREVFRVGMPVYDHPIKQIAFNPYAEPGDEDYGLLYIAHGDGSTQSATIGGGQNADGLGKIIRVDPLEDGANSYSVPATNPFVGDASMLDEIYALGFRNPHNLAFTQTPDGESHLVVGAVGRDNFEEVNVVVAGGNYGWSEREGPLLHLQNDDGNINGVTDLPANEADLGFIYPAVFLAHDAPFGQGNSGTAIAGGLVVNNGSALDGLSIFGEFASTGRLFSADFGAMLDAITQLDPNDPSRDEPGELTSVTPSELTVLFDHDNDPTTTPIAYQDIKDIFGTSRADFRFGLGPDGTLYITNKRDGYVYRVENSRPVDAGPVDLKINFQTSGDTIAPGYSVDDGSAFDADRGWGWASFSTGGDAAAAIATSAAIGLSGRFQSHATVSDDLAWEVALADGFYTVTIGLGDADAAAAPASIDIEGVSFSADVAFSDLGKFSIVTGIVEVTDGKLTLDGAGSSAPLAFIEIETLEDINPGNGVDAPDELPRLLLTNPLEGEAGVDPDSGIAFDVALIGGSGVEPGSLSSATVKLIRTKDGLEIPGLANTTGGNDALVFTPTGALEDEEQYTLIVDGVTDLDGREFQKATVNFTTGVDDDPDPAAPAFSSADFYSGLPVTSLLMSPDGLYLYAATFTGDVLRFEVDQTTGEMLNQQTLSLPELGGRAIIGMAFDPTDPNRLWITNNDPVSGTSTDFTGKLSYIDLDPGAAFSGEITDYVVNLPRSARDHLSNSIQFHEDPDNAGEYLLYLIQGSNTAQGAPDENWRLRPERLLSAALLEIDPDRDVSGGPINVQTEDYTAEDYTNDPGAFSTGSYDPYAPDAPVRIYATGIRNSYDFLFHSNGKLYATVNGSASGGNTPDNPNTAIDEGVTNVSKQNDFLLDVEEGLYYGHPNPTRDEYVLYGGNPTNGVDPVEVPDYAVGVQPEANWAGVIWDFSNNRSVNGIIEYKSDQFGGALQGKLIVSEYSQGDDLLILDVGPDGEILSSTPLAAPGGFTLQFANPLDLIEGPNGVIYVAAFDKNLGVINLVAPADPTDVPPVPPGGLYQAELAAIFGSGTKILLETDPDANLKNGYTGEGYVDFGSDIGDYVEWTITAEEDGDYQLDFTYANGSSAARPLALSVDGVLVAQFPIEPTANWRDWVDATQTVSLNAGAHKVRLTTVEATGPNVDALTVTPLVTPKPVYQAEDGALTGAAIIDDAFLGAIGELYVDFGPGAGDTLTLDIAVASDAVYELTFRYALVDTAPRPMALSIDGGPAQIIDFDPIGPTFDVWGEITQLVTLSAGEHVLELATTGEGGPNLDQIAVQEYNPGSSLAEIRIETLDPGPFEDFLAFNTYPHGENSRFEPHDTDSFRIHNDGTETLEISAMTVDGPFSFLDPNQATQLSIAPGESVDVGIYAEQVIEEPELEFVGTGAVTILSNDGDEQVSTVDLSAFIAPIATRAYAEPSAADMLTALGYYNTIVRNDLRNANYAVVELTDEEVLVRSWVAADPNQDVRVTQIAQFSGSNSQTSYVHSAGNKFDRSLLWTTEANDQRSFYPTNSAEQISTATFDGESPFGISLGNQSSDPYLNSSSTVEYDGQTYRYGMAIRTYEVYDLDQNRIDNAYVMIYDGLGGNADYNDAAYLLENVSPFEFI